MKRSELRKIIKEALDNKKLINEDSWDNEIFPGISLTKNQIREIPKSIFTNSTFGTLSKVTEKNGRLLIKIELNNVPSDELTSQKGKELANKYSEIASIPIKFGRFIKNTSSTDMSSYEPGKMSSIYTDQAGFRNNPNISNITTKYVTLYADLKKQINESQELQEEPMEIIDEIGKFFVVTKPKTKTATVEDLVSEQTIASYIASEHELPNTIGFFKQKSDARRKATELIKEFESQLKEVETSMAEFRKAQQDINSKKQSTKDLILKLKPKTSEQNTSEEKIE